MTSILIDPLSAFMDRHLNAMERWPTPLVSTSFDVVIEAGLAMIETQRLFRNSEEHSIEAAISFPVPIHAAFYHLEARIDDRVLTGVARSKNAARKGYEVAVERGRTAALHEELLPGIHMLSLANIRPGGVIQVTTRWIMPLTFVGAEGHLRIPLTVGDVYGQSGLPETDEVTTSAKVEVGNLTVRSSGEAVTYRSGAISHAMTNDKQGAVIIPMNRPIDLYVSKWRARKLFGLDGKAKRMTVTLCPEDHGEEKIDLAILVDRSGSMGATCSPDTNMTMCEATDMGLMQLCEVMKDSDAVSLWAFDTQPTHIGIARIEESGVSVAAQFESLITQLPPPRGGTATGLALRQVINTSKANDILVLTDGMSYSMDIDRLAASGRRISALLIGEDSLEAKLGHLVAETGGNLFIASDTDIGEKLVSVVGSIRKLKQERLIAPMPLTRATIMRNNVKIAATWTRKKLAQSEDQLLPIKAVGAAGAALMLPLLEPKKATSLALRHNLLTRRTSLLLVDEAGETQEGLPAFRKVSLAKPAEGRRFFSIAPPSVKTSSGDFNFSDPAVSISGGQNFHSMDYGENSSLSSRRPSVKFWGKINLSKRLQKMLNIADPENLEALQCLLREKLGPSAAGLKIDWGSNATNLIEGRVSGLPEPFRQKLDDLFNDKAVIALSKVLTKEPQDVVIGLIALYQSNDNRHAQRIAKFMLGDWRAVLSSKMIEMITKELALRK
jgi:hypothetical protein